MKRTLRTLLSFVAVAALLASCSEKIAPEAEPAVEDNFATIDVLPTGDGWNTKVAGTVNTNPSGNIATTEGNVKSLQVFVFNGDVRDGYVEAKVTGSATTLSGPASVQCTAGTRDIWCVVNAPSLSSISTKTALLAATSQLSTNSNSNGFVMVGSKASVTVSAGSNSQTVPVSLIAAKVVIKSIENNLGAGGAMTVKRVYITNVAGQINYGLTAYPGASDKWYNKGGYRSASADNLGTFTQDVDLSANVAHGKSYTTNHYFYAYPNNYAQANYAATWVPKRTMLVVQIQYGGKLYDYPVDLGVSLEPGKMYVLTNLKLSSLGNPDDGAEGGADEENPVSRSTVNVSVDVQDWTVVNISEIEY